MDLPTVLANAQNRDNNIRGQAEAFLNEAVESQYGPFLLALTVQFSTENNPETSRQLAGLYIKNLIDAKDNLIYEKKLERWNSCDPSIKHQVKAGFLQALLSQSRLVNRTAAQVIGAFGAVEFPNKNWPQLLPSLLANISSPAVSTESKVASLESLGYLCDSMDPEVIDSSDVNTILTAIVNSLRADLPDEIREAAISALFNSLDFTSRNFEVPEERDVIIRAIGESTQSSHVKTRQKAFECIAKIPDLYYDKIGNYITGFYQLTTNAISTDVPEVASQAIEFWITVALFEINAIEEIEDDMEGVVYLKIIEQAAKPMLPMLLVALTKQPENPDEDTSSYIADSAATCLDAFTRILKDSIVDVVLSFISANIGSKDWHQKEAAVTAFGSILDGPSSQKMLPVLTQALPVLIACFQDSVPIVKASAGWTIGRICEFHKNAISMESLPVLVSAIGTALDDEDAVVSSRACFALHNLAKACQSEADEETNVLSHFLAAMLQKLFTIANRSDWNEENLRSSAYEASNMLISNCAKDMHVVVGQVLMECIRRLELALNSAIDAHERMNLQSHLCSLLGECVKKLTAADINPHADKIMGVLLQVFSVRSAIAHEDAFLALGFLADKMESSFTRYLQYVREPIMIGLRNLAEYQVCIVALGALGDICRAINDGIIPLCEEILGAVLDILRSTSVDRSVKPHAISAFADISMAIGAQFDRYAAIVLGILQQASTVSAANEDDEGEIEYINTLRSSILEAYTAILHTLNDSNKQDIIVTHIDDITNLVKICAEDEDKSEELLKSVVGLIGDLGKVFGSKLTLFLTDPVIVRTVQEATDNEDVSDLARWTQTIMFSAINSRK